MSFREFDCTGCGLNTATLDPSLIECDDCRDEALFCVECDAELLTTDDDTCQACLIAEARGIFL